MNRETSGGWIWKNYWRNLQSFKMEFKVLLTRTLCDNSKKLQKILAFAHWRLNGFEFCTYEFWSQKCDICLALHLLTCRSFWIVKFVDLCLLVSARRFLCETHFIFLVQSGKLAVQCAMGTAHAYAHSIQSICYGTYVCGTQRRSRFLAISCLLFLLPFLTISRIRTHALRAKEYRFIDEK